MTTTDPSAPYMPSAPRLIRRSPDDRVVAGVCGGMAEYLAIDPVILRVLFAVTSFLGIGVVAYLVAWAIIPERGVRDAPTDRFIAELRRRHVPVWLVVTVLGVAGWALLFSWWTPWPFFPLAVAIAIVALAIKRRDQPPTPRADGLPSSGPTPAAGASGLGGWVTATGTEPSPAPIPDGGTVSLVKGPADDLSGNEPGGFGDGSTPRSELAGWMAESRAAGRERRHRAAPVRWATLGTLLATLVVLAVVDALNGVAIPVYFWATLVIVGGGLAIGMILRRTPWVVVPLLIPAIVGIVAFTGTSASMHDGSGDRLAAPTSPADLASNYRQAFGRLTLDLTGMPMPTTSRTVQLVQAAGQVRVLVPRDQAVLIRGEVGRGVITVDGVEKASGFDVNRDVAPTVTGPQLTIDVDLRVGQLLVDHTG
jgi:phage shock protein PspC (stress-responsive transcriptional regulator)/FtsH-binding integral membrane protein